MISGAEIIFLVTLNEGMLMKYLKLKNPVVSQSEAASVDGNFY